MAKTIIFTDGASRGNPGAGGWGAIVFENSEVNEFGGQENNTTNNRMELTAVVEALKNAEAKNIEVFTDSTYVVKGITSWVFSWQENGWKTKTKDPVINKDLWEKLVSETTGKKIDWHIIPGHSGLPGNEQCDVIATSFADINPIELYSGPRANYPVDVENLEINESAKTKRDRSRSRSKAYSYISEVNGVVKTHTSWAECETRVKGKKARFKKSLSREEEREIIADFSGE